MNAWEWLQSQLSGQPAPEATNTRPAATPPPTLPDADREELTRLRAAESARKESDKAALSARKEAVKASAVRAYGADSPKYAVAARGIEAAADVATLDTMEALMPEPPAALQPRGRVTVPAAQNPAGGTQPPATLEDEMGEMMAAAGKKLGDQRLAKGRVN